MPDLTIIGFGEEVARHEGAAIFKTYESIGNTLFVNAAEQIKIK